MLKTLKISGFFIFFLFSNIAASQTIEGLQEIVKLQQDKISKVKLM